MSEQQPDEIGHWSAATYIDPKLAEGPPVGAWIDKDAVCRDCMTGAEDNSLRRGFIDPISGKEAAEKTPVCVRCQKPIMRTA